jgi:hypothetical protein
VQEVPEFVMTSAEASCRVYRTEATHRTISALDPPMILFNPVVEVLAVPVSDIRAELASDRTRVTVMPVRGHPCRRDASDRSGRSKELLCAAISRVSLSITSTRAPVRSIARYR